MLTNRSIGCFMVSLCFVWSGIARADVLTVNPDTGQLSNGGAFAASVDWHGVQITDGGTGQDHARQYLVHGDFTVNSGDTVTATLSLGNYSRPVRFIVANNATLAGTIDMSGSGTQGRAGGGRAGVGGAGAAGGATGTGGGGGVGDSVTGTGGPGGAGGAINTLGEDGGSGAYGWDYYHGDVGATYNGGQGGSGGAGWEGFGSSLRTFTPSSTNAGAGGTGGSIYDTLHNAVGGSGGPNGTGWGVGGSGGGGGAGGHAGGNGGNGGHGSAGGNGNDGLTGRSKQGQSLSGGSGGSGGQGGGGGGGGDAGTRGGGGGGGGGGAGNNFVWPFGATGDAGGAGGLAGKGGNGGGGGDGGAGGDGGRGGDAGGGAFELQVLGQLHLDGGSLLAQGSPYGPEPATSGTGGLAGFTGTTGANGSAGGNGAVGAFDTRVSPTGAAGGSGKPGGSGAALGGSATAGTSGFGGEAGVNHGSYGGTGGGGGGGGGAGGGGHGGTGGSGAASGNGGEGGAGGGGTVFISATSVSGSGTVNTRRGDAPANPVVDALYDGKFSFRRNTTDVWSGSLASGTQYYPIDENGNNYGPRTFNPFIHPDLYSYSQKRTPYIPNLIDGADVCGLSSLSADDPELAALVSQAPVWAGTALYMMEDGPAGLGQAWDGFDMLLMVNLTDQTLPQPRIGIGYFDYLTELQLGGWARSSQFGGAGYEVLNALPAKGVYALLVPEWIQQFNIDAQGHDRVSTFDMNPGDALYLYELVGDLDGDGFVGITDLNVVLSNWNQFVPPGDPAADPSGDGFIGIEDLNIVLGNWNAGTLPPTSAVPEPATLMLLMLGGALSLSRPRN